jgi:hypothetical protein
MSRLCKNCIYWKRTILPGQGFCSREKRYRQSLYLCNLFEGRPPSFKERAGELLAYLWEKSGQPVADAATSSRKTLEMLIVFTFMLIAFIVMSVYIYPMVKKAAINVYGGAVAGPADNSGGD